MQLGIDARLAQETQHWIRMRSSESAKRAHPARSRAKFRAGSSSPGRTRALAAQIAFAEMRGLRSCFNLVPLQSNEAPTSSLTDTV